MAAKTGAYKALQEKLRLVPSIKLKFTSEGITLITPKDIPSQLLAQKPLKKIKSKVEMCQACEKQPKKYVCSKTKLISCSLECYKINLKK